MWRQWEGNLPFYKKKPPTEPEPGSEPEPKRDTKRNRGTDEGIFSTFLTIEDKLKLQNEIV